MVDDSGQPPPIDTGAVDMRDVRPVAIGACLMAGVAVGVVVLRSGGSRTPVQVASGYNKPAHIRDMPGLENRGRASHLPEDVLLRDKMFVVSVDSIDAVVGAHLRRPATLLGDTVVVAIEYPGARTPYGTPAAGSAPDIAHMSPQELANVGIHIMEIPGSINAPVMTYTDILAHGGVDYYYSFRPETAPAEIVQAAIAKGLIAVVNVNGETAWPQRISSSLSELNMWYTDVATGKRLLLTLSADKTPDELLQLARQAS
jgi:hypothetical protein